MKAKIPAAVILVVLVAFSISTAQDAMQDVVYLKNGSIVRGVIIEQIPNRTIKIQTKDGSVFVYQMGEVEKITKEGPVRSEAASPGTGAFGVRGTIGTDISGGLGYGGGFSYVWSPYFGASNIEVGVDFIYSKTTENTSNNRSEVTKLSVFAARVNWLFNYQPHEGSVYFVVGTGFVGASLNWKEISGPNGTGNILDDADYGSAGNVVNLGVGWASRGGLDVRIETPLLFFYSVGNASSFSPTLTGSLMYRF